MHIPCQAFQFFEAGLVEPRVALFRKPNPTCTADEAAVDARVAAAAKAAKDAADLAAAKDDDDDLNVGLVITLAVLAVALLLTVSVVAHLIRMVRRVPAPLPPPPPCPCSHPPAAPARDETQPR